MEIGSIQNSFFISPAAFVKWNWIEACLVQINQLKNETDFGFGL
jgi:hypothetical protein